MLESAIYSSRSSHELDEWQQIASSGLLRNRSAFLERFYPVWNYLPRGFGAHKNMPADFNIRIAIQAPESHTMNGSLIDAAECRAAPIAKLQAKSVFANVGR